MEDGGVQDRAGRRAEGERRDETLKLLHALCAREDAAGVPGITSNRRRN